MLNAKLLRTHPQKLNKHHVYALNARNNFSQVNSTNILCYNVIVENVINVEKLWWMRENIFPRKKFIKHQLQYHVHNMKKVMFLEKENKKHEQNKVKSGPNIIPASREMSK